MACAKKQELADGVNRLLVKLSELIHAEIAAISHSGEDAWLAIDMEIEETLGAKQRAVGAWRTTVDRARSQRLFCKPFIAVDSVIAFPADSEVSRGLLEVDQ